MISFLLFLASIAAVASAEFLLGQVNTPLSSNESRVICLTFEEEMVLISRTSPPKELTLAPAMRAAACLGRGSKCWRIPSVVQLVPRPDRKPSPTSLQSSLWIACVEFESSVSSFTGKNIRCCSILTGVIEDDTLH
nr:hypothetical protein Iba_scaffold17533CG0080 [Ipomoea batatas]GME16488.1 hypothetical protein Iba_scaffold17535CG0350 [Ipomoea batatas]